MHESICHPIFRSARVALAAAAMLSLLSASPASPVVRTLERPHPEPSVGVAPIAIAFVPALSFPSENWSVAGVRINMLVGRHRDVRGLDASLLGGVVSDEFEGVQISGVFSEIGGSDGAVQASGLFNFCDGDFCGLQIAGLANGTSGDFSGAQVALLNRVSDLFGLQVGLYNATDHGSGVQIGVINAARVFDGLQIGLVNVIRDSSVPFFPIANFAF